MMELKKTMKAVVVAEEGKLVVKDVPVPVPSEGRVLIKVATAAQNPTDRTLLTASPPFSPQLIKLIVNAVNISETPSTQTYHLLDIGILYILQWV